MARTNQKHRNVRAAEASAPPPFTPPVKEKTFYEQHKATTEQSAAWFRSRLLTGLPELTQAHLGTCLRILDNCGGFAPFYGFFTSLLYMVEGGTEVTPTAIEMELEKTMKDLFKDAAGDISLFAFSNPTLCRELVEQGEQERRDLFMEVQSGKAPKREEDS